MVAPKPSGPVAEPFPADVNKRESTEALASSIAPPSSMPAERGAAEPASGKLGAGPAPSARGEFTREAQRTAAPAAQFAAPAKRMAKENDTARAQAAASMSDPTSDGHAKLPPKLAVPDWIALIRKLRDEDRMDEAAKELTAFRAAYPDHERLLPSDLRDWKPAPR